jgi:hypothetical protein
VELALGTVQFGLSYGVAGRGMPVPEDEVRLILRRAHELGIRLLDTAHAYGDIQGRLVRLSPCGAFKIVTKLPAVPTDIDVRQAQEWVGTALQRARDELGSSLHAVMFHRAEDLLDERGPALWDCCARWADDFGCKLGVSCYDPQVLVQVKARFPVAIAQLPGNVLDQRLASMPPSCTGGIDIHIRSAFLQGLLLISEAQAIRSVPRSASALRRWHAWLSEHDLQPLHAALGFVKGLPGASHCVVGVDTLDQLEEVAAAWQAAPALHADGLATVDPGVIDPRHWPQ